MADSLHQLVLHSSKVGSAMDMCRELTGSLEAALKVCTLFQEFDFDGRLAVLFNLVSVVHTSPSFDFFTAER